MSTKKTAKKKAKRPARPVSTKQSPPLSAAALLGANGRPLVSNICHFDSFPALFCGESREQKLIGIIRRLTDVL